MGVDKTIVALRFSALGDVAMSLVSVKKVLEENPNVRIVLITKFELKRLVENDPRLIVVPVDLKNEFAGFAGLIRLFLELRKAFPTAMIADLHGVIRTRILTFLFKSTGRQTATVSKDRAGKKRLTRRIQKVLAPLPTMFDRYADVFRQLGCIVSSDSVPPIFNIRGSNTVNALNLPAKSGSRWIGVAPFSAHHGKTYPLHQMEEVVNVLNRTRRCQVFLLGAGAEEVGILKLVEAVNPGVISLASISLEDQLSVISRLDVVISMDSANMHLASLFGVPVVSVWGATHPYAGFMGSGQSMRNAVQLSLSCRPCSIYGEKRCWRGDYACIEQITPGMILEKVFRILGAR